MGMLELADVSKVYGSGTSAVTAVRDLSLEIEGGEFVAVTGASGSGKSTLLNLMAGLDPPSRGQVRLLGAELVTLDDRALSRLRLTSVGFVFQSFHLFPALDVEQNVAWPLELAGLRRREIRRAVGEVLEQMGVARHRHRRPAELSGGEQQRVAIARALVNDPRILFADEPTGNLDSITGDAVLGLLGRLSRERGLTIVMVTHRSDCDRWAARTVQMRDGRLVRDRTGPCVVLARCP